MRSLLLGKIASDLAAKRSRILSATARSAGSSEARGSDTTFCSIALTGSVDFTGVASMVAAGESLAGAVGAEDVSADCPAGEAPVGTAVKSPHWKTLKRATRSHGDSHARQDPVETRALHIAYVSTSVPATFAHFRS